MRIDIVTVFPEMVRDALGHSIIKRAMDSGLVTINAIDLRDFSYDRHKTTDDIPYGGGGGMVMKVEPIARAIKHLTDGLGETQPVTVSSSNPQAVDTGPIQPAGMPENSPGTSPRIVLTDPRGAKFDQATARRWAKESHLILLCGHYEGVDERVRLHLVTDEVSIGDYVLTGGELPALVIVDAITRLQPGALGDSNAPENDSFAEDLLEYPHYTRPNEYLGWKAPEILLSGHHAEINRWRRWQQLRATYSRRPDLFSRLDLSAQDNKLFSGPEPQCPVDTKSIRRNSNHNKKHEDTDGTGI
jgi:tRNA (guanine37-N1)-methyltransferase